MPQNEMRDKRREIQFNCCKCLSFAICPSEFNSIETLIAPHLVSTHIGSSQSVNCMPRWRPVSINNTNNSIGGSGINSNIISLPLITHLTTRRPPTWDRTASSAYPRDSHRHVCRRSREWNRMPVPGFALRSWWQCKWESLCWPHYRRCTEFPA